MLFEKVFNFRRGFLGFRFRASDSGLQGFTEFRVWFLCLGSSWIACYAAYDPDKEKAIEHYVLHQTMACQRWLCERPLSWAESVARRVVTCHLYLFIVCIDSALGFVSWL